MQSVTNVTKLWRLKKYIYNYPVYKRPIRSKVSRQYDEYHRMNKDGIINLPAQNYTYAKASKPAAVKKDTVLIIKPFKNKDMKKNMGTVDRVARLVIAALVAYLYYNKTIAGTFGVVLLILAGVFVLTSFIGFCPLYRIFGANTSASGKK